MWFHIFNFLIARFDIELTIVCQILEMHNRTPSKGILHHSCLPKLETVLKNIQKQRNLVFFYFFKFTLLFYLCLCEKKKKTKQNLTEPDLVITFNN